MENRELLSKQMRDVAATSLLTLYCHRIESQSPKPLLHDPLAVEITDKLTPELSKSDNKLHQSLVNSKIDRKLVVHIALRARRYDEYARQFLERSPEGIIVNIGCGLDTRFQRIDNGKAICYDLDFPEVIALKKQFLVENERYRFITSSALDYEWMEPLLQLSNHSFLFMAEGVFMYLQEEEVKSLVLQLQAQFPSSELVCEVFNSFWLRKPLKGIIDTALRRKLHFGEEATFNFGIRDGKELELWNPGIEFLEEWSYLDEPEEKLGWLQFLGHMALFRKMEWTVRYRLN